MTQILGRHYSTNDPICVSIENGLIKAIQSLEQSTGVEPTTLPVIAPTLVDLQVNGLLGDDFLSPDIDQNSIGELLLRLPAIGVTACCPTFTTQSYEMLSQAMASLSSAMEADRELATLVPGIHLEGPYISKQDGPRGAHPLDHCRSPDWDEFRRLQDSANGRIRIVTLSPEYDEAINFIRQASNDGIKVAIGHTAATSDQVRAAVDAGATLSTHLGNGAHAKIARHPNYIWEQLDDDRLTASVIADGHHLPDSVLRCFLRCKGKERLVLVSDMTGMAGMDPGVYSNEMLGEVEVLASGKLVVAGQREYLAGASQPLIYGVMHMMRTCNLSLEESLAMASQQPASILGMETPELEIGRVANLLELEPDVPKAERHSYRLQNIWWRGNSVSPSTLTQN